MVDLTNLSGTFQFDDEIGLRDVAAELRRQGLVVETGEGDSSPRTVRADRARMTRRTHGHEHCYLEDNLDRQAIMRACLADRFYMFDVRFFDDSCEMIRFLEGNLNETLVIALDNDLS